MYAYISQYRVVCLAILLSLMISSCTTQIDEAILPAPNDYVTDFPKILSIEQTAALERSLSAIEKTGRAQIFVYIANELGEHVLEELTLRSANAWGIGDRKKDNGLVIFLFLKERRIRIEVGIGLNKIITDEFAKTVIKEDMVPAFRKGQFGEGLSAAVDSIIGRLSKETA
jgi:uncharacterized protein